MGITISKWNILCLCVNQRQWQHLLWERLHVCSVRHAKDELCTKKKDNLHLSYLSSTHFLFTTLTDSSVCIKLIVLFYNLLFFWSTRPFFLSLSLPGSGTLPLKGSHVTSPPPVWAGIPCSWTVGAPGPSCWCPQWSGQQCLLPLHPVPGQR